MKPASLAKLDKCIREGDEYDASDMICDVIFTVTRAGKFADKGKWEDAYAQLKDAKGLLDSAIEMTNELWS